MPDPIEICIDISSHIVAGIRAAFPDFRFWHSAERMSSTSACLRLYIADHRLPAFAHVDIRSEIPASSFSMRSLGVHTRADNWNERDCPGLRTIEEDLPGIIESERGKLRVMPFFGLTTVIPDIKGMKSYKRLEINFVEMLGEFDVEKGERPDYDGIAADVVKQIEAIRRVLVRAREPSRQA